jgi:carbon starvation protein
VLIANPKLEAPAVNGVFLNGGPTVPGKIFPFLFITIMCGAISGFHALVSSGTTPKMIKSESSARAIGYGAMLIEGLVGVCAMIAASTLPVGDYYAMNTDLGKVPAFQDKFVRIGANIDHLNIYEQRTQEALRGRTGGAVTLAVGMAHIFDGMSQRVGITSEKTLETMWKYWYHFAVMFEALFILTTIDTGTRIGRFLLQEIMGKTIGGKWGQTDWWPSAILSTLLIVIAWGFFIVNNSMDLIWPMFGVGNQMLAVIALSIVSVYLVNSGKTRYLWVTVLPMTFVFITTSAGAVDQFIGKLDTIQTQLSKPGDIDKIVLFNSCVTAGLLVLTELCAIIIIVASAIKIWNVTGGFRPQRGFEPVLARK